MTGDAIDLADHIEWARDRDRADRLSAVRARLAAWTLTSKRVVRCAICSTLAWGLCRVRATTAAGRRPPTTTIEKVLMRAPTSPLARRLTAVAVPILMLVALLAWGFSSPVGSSPDDDFHLPSIWCGLGERPGLCEESGSADSRLVPAAIVGEACYARDATESGACWDGSRTELAQTNRVNVNALYPPLFYGVMSLFAGSDIATSVLLMRAFNSILVVGVLTAVFFALPRRLRPVLVVSALATIVPLGMFVISSTNASSWAFLSAATLWLSLYGATQTSGARHYVLCALALFAAVLGAGARADAGAFAVLGVGIAAILGMRRSRQALAPALTGVAIVIIAAAFYLTSSQGSLADGLGTPNPPLTTIQIAQNFLEVPDLWIGAFGGWGLGWLDTPLPAAVSVLAFAVFSSAIFLGVRRLDVRRGLALGVSASAAWLVPWILLTQSHAFAGTYVQPRYILPLLVIVAGVATLVGRRDTTVRPDREWTTTRLLIAAVALAFANAVALHVNLRRYITGLDAPAFNPGRDAEWWWPSAAPPGLVWALGVIAFAGVFVGVELARRLERIEAPSPLRLEGSLRA
jgi:hypothetical protein